MLFNGIGKYKGEFSCGNLQGSGCLQYLDGSFYDGDWKENKKHGIGKFIEKNGETIFNGMWQKDQKHGRGTFF